jgi:crotonobetainyl-CoA:carnitine CoA-transferase CaiB-like acyl-CoA transferase
MKARVRNGGVTKGRPKSLPLEGLRVIEVASLYAGPWVACVLAEFGADVIKVELPPTGDQARMWQPLKNEVSLPFARMNFDKRSIGLDLHREEGREVFNRLASTADVVTVGVRASTQRRWGIDYKTLSVHNPRMIHVSVTGFGTTGPYKDRPGVGSAADSMSGFAYLNGWPNTPPTMANFGLTDLIAGTTGVLGTMMALYRREVNGRGDEVDVALVDPMMTIIGDAVLAYSALGTIRQRTGNIVPNVSPIGIFKSKDGHWMSVSASAQSVAVRLFTAIGKPEAMTDPRYSTNAARVERDAEIQGWIAAWVIQHTRAEALRILTDAEVTCGPVNDARDITEDPHFRERTLVGIDSDQIGPAVTPTLFRLGSSPTRRHGEAPKFGQHTDEVLSTVLNYKPDAIAQLRKAGVVA